MNERIMVHIVDDDPAVRSSVITLLRAKGYQVAQYASGEAFVETAVWDVPGCLILDLRMPGGMSGEHLLAELASDGDPPPTVVLTGHGTVDNAVRVMKSGALEFLTKPCESGVLLEALERGIEKDKERLTRKRELAELHGLVATLTPREKIILEEMATGKTSPEIASKLGLQPKSVQVYRSRVLQKMKFATTVELVRHLLLSEPQAWT